MAERKDIDLNFSFNPMTNDLGVKKGKSAIKQSLRNIVLTNFYERGFNIQLGTDVRASLFEVIGASEVQTLKDNINQAVDNFEPNVELIEINVSKNGDNGLLVQIVYNTYNDPTEESVTVSLDRLR